MIDNLMFGGKTLDEALEAHTPLPPAPPFASSRAVPLSEARRVVRVRRLGEDASLWKEVRVIRRQWGVTGAGGTDDRWFWYVLDQRGSRMRYVAQEHRFAIRLATVLASRRRPARCAA